MAVAGWHLHQDKLIIHKHLRTWRNLLSLVHLKPTFALSHHYNSGKIPLIHLDLYRLDNVSSAKEVFFSEEEEAIQRQAILVIEWPELIEPVIDNFWKIKISYAKNYGRNYEISDPKNLLTFS